MGGKVGRGSRGSAAEKVLTARASFHEFSELEQFADGVKVASHNRLLRLLFMTAGRAKLPETSSQLVLREDAVEDGRTELASKDLSVPNEPRRTRYLREPCQ